jgi:hypothetical protein
LRRVFLDTNIVLDALQAVSAEACAADAIVTRNVADFARGRVPVLTPAEFLVRFPA